MKRTARVICPVCHDEVTARRTADGELMVKPHELRRYGLVLLDLNRSSASRYCRGTGARAESLAPRPRPISYEETVRVIDALLGESA